MEGLYALKPWFADRLAVVRRALIRGGVSPGWITFFGTLFAAGAGLALAFLPIPVAALPVAVLLVARLACANLDGSVARETGRETHAGSLVNEVGDRAADLLVLCGLVTHLPLSYVLGAAICVSVPSWISLAGAAAGIHRINGGPMGKTERCLVYVLAAATGLYLVATFVLAVGSLVTALFRAWRVVRAAEPIENRAPLGRTVS